MNDGGPAFPIDKHMNQGMSLRDYFASHAPLEGLGKAVSHMDDESLTKVLGFTIDREEQLSDEEELTLILELGAAMAYRWADAMLKQGAK